MCGVASGASFRVRRGGSIAEGEHMAIKRSLFAATLLTVAMLLPPSIYAGGVGRERPVFRVGVGVVLLNFTVRDKNGEHIGGLKPGDIRVLENGTPQRIDSFAEGAKLIQGDTAYERAGASVFVLFDTSDYMYRSFVHAQDAITGFIRGLDEADSVAVYCFSRNLQNQLKPDCKPPNVKIGVHVHEWPPRGGGG
jgi:hypothetical protein